MRETKPEKRFKVCRFVQAKYQTYRIVRFGRGLILFVMVTHCSLFYFQRRLQTRRQWSMTFFRKTVQTFLDQYVFSSPSVFVFVHLRKRSLLVAYRGKTVLEVLWVGDLSLYFFFLGETNGDWCCLGVCDIHGCDADFFNRLSLSLFFPVKQWNISSR